MATTRYWALPRPAMSTVTTSFDRFKNLYPNRSPAYTNASSSGDDADNWVPVTTLFWPRGDNKKPNQCGSEEDRPLNITQHTHIDFDRTKAPRPRGLTEVRGQTLVLRGVGDGPRARERGRTASRTVSSTMVWLSTSCSIIWWISHAWSGWACLTKGCNRAWSMTQVPGRTATARHPSINQPHTATQGEHSNSSEQTQSRKAYCSTQACPLGCAPAPNEV
jgi:hypothetical protein